MKATPYQYAAAIFEETRGKNPAEVDEKISNLVKILEKNGQLKLVPRLIEKFEEIYDKENKIIKAEVTSKEKIDNLLQEKIELFIKKRYGAEKVSLEQKIDSGIRGGIIIRVGDEIMDGSLIRKLRDLRSKLIS